MHQFAYRGLGTNLNIVASGFASHGASASATAGARRTARSSSSVMRIVSRISSNFASIVRSCSGARSPCSRLSWMARARLMLYWLRCAASVASSGRWSRPRPSSRIVEPSSVLGPSTIVDPSTPPSVSASESRAAGFVLAVGRPGCASNRRSVAFGAPSFFVLSRAASLRSMATNKPAMASAAQAARTSSILACSQAGLVGGLVGALAPHSPAAHSSPPASSAAVGSSAGSSAASANSEREYVCRFSTATSTTAPDSAASPAAVASSASAVSQSASTAASLASWRQTDLLYMNHAVSMPVHSFTTARFLL
ncbi:hypothetical protein M885DRAFT_534019, partial [Pelagophyceae sp. CCMP2097]